MEISNLSVRELREEDIPMILDYWSNAEEAFLIGMGVDLNKLPPSILFKGMLLEQLAQSYKEKNSYCLIWEIDKKPAGHSNVNKIIYAEEAYMHLHLWSQTSRQKGAGVSLVRQSLPYFFNNLELKNLYCEPYALNPAPNKTLEKVGFKFIKEYITTPGMINFEQPVKRWQLSYDDFQKL